MSTGRLTMRGRVFQPRVFAGWALGNSGAVVSVANVTTRLTLIGTSRQRLTIEGTSTQRQTVCGTSRRRLSLDGTSNP